MESLNIPLESPHVGVLQERGLSRVANVSGGMLAWQQAGFALASAGQAVTSPLRRASTRGSISLLSAGGQRAQAGLIAETDRW